LKSRLFESIETAFVESVDGVAHCLGSATQRAGYLWRALAASARKQNLAAAQDEGIGGAQSGFQGFALLL
jgi:hypothetical protein